MKYFVQNYYILIFLSFSKKDRKERTIKTWLNSPKIITWLSYVNVTIGSVHWKLFFLVKSVHWKLIITKIRQKAENNMIDILNVSMEQSCCFLNIKILNSNLLILIVKINTYIQSCVIICNHIDQTMINV